MLMDAECPAQMTTKGIDATKHNSDTSPIVQHHPFVYIVQ